MFRISFLLIPLWFVALSLQAAETRYITDVFEVTMRSGTSTANSIVRLLRSGEAVTLLEVDEGTQYSLVETADGKQGYVLNRFLETSPAARELLEKLTTRHQQLQARFDEQATEIDDLKQVLQQEQADNQSLKTALRASEQELSGVRDAAENTLNILDQNKRMQVMVDQLREEKAVLSDTNARLSDSTQIDWFVRGAAVSLIAFFIGILVTRISWRKKDSWGSY
jgi:SH3 domain protein